MFSPQGQRRFASEQLVLLTPWHDFLRTISVRSAADHQVDPTPCRARPFLSPGGRHLDDWAERTSPANPEMVLGYRASLTGGEELSPNDYAAGFVLRCSCGPPRSGAWLSIAARFALQGFRGFAQGEGHVDKA